MDKETLRLPSDPNSEACSSGAPGTLPYQGCSSPTYHVTSTTIGPPGGGYSQFMPSSTSSAGHSLPPPPGLSHPGLSNVYQYPSHCPLPSYQSIGFSTEMSGASATQAHLSGHFSNAPCLKPTTGQYNNGYSVQNGGVPGYSGYQYFGNTQQPHILPRDNSVGGISHQSQGPLFSKPPYDHGTYQQGTEEFKEQFSLMTGARSDRYEIGHRKEFSLNQLRSPNFHESAIGGINSSKNDSKTSISNGVGRVMNPIIENLVGSMSMCNGTYTHFGPSATLTSKGLNGHSEILSESNLVPKQVSSLEAEQKVLFSKASVTPVSQNEIDLEGNCNATLTNPVIKPEAKIIRPIQSLSDQDLTFENNKASLSKSNLNTGASSDTNQQRSVSPRDSIESTSRPQTPGKPSYLEVLTKAGIKGAANVNSPSSRKTSSSSSSPVQSAFSASNDSFSNQGHRKSVDIFTGSASTPSSSCPSSSSSPATKQRNSVTGMVSKGKENLSGSIGGSSKRQSSIDRSSPSNSPSHQAIQQNQHQYHSKTKLPPGLSNGTGEERKVLSSQNSSTSKASKPSRNGKTSTEKLSQFEDLKDDGDWGWKTYTSRSRNNNVNNIGNKNSQKRSSVGQSSLESGIANLKVLDDGDDDDEDDDDSYLKTAGGDESIPERKPGISNFATLTTNNTGGSGVTHSRKPREKEKSRSRKEDRNCVSRRLESLVYMWLNHLISALTWLWSLITDVASLSASLGVSLMQDFYGWTRTKALPNMSDVMARWRKAIWKTFYNLWNNGMTKLGSIFSRSGKKAGQEDSNSKPTSDSDNNILSLLGPERNITLPANGDEALKRLLSVKGQDPYSILGVRSDSSDETIRRYYKRQAVLVHPDKNLIVGAEEAFKILARAFEMVGDPLKRAEYHQKLMEAQAKEKFCGEIGNLLEQLRKKMEAASSTIRCTKCNSRHKKNITDRPLFAARYCSQCRIHHGAREGELWAECKGWFGLAWNYFACMDGHVWEINEWARCQKANLKHIKADAHCVMYRLVAGGNNHNQNHNNQHCHGNGTSFEDGAGSEADEWDSLINNLYKSPPGSAYGKTSGVPGKPGCCSTGTQNNNSNSSVNQTAGRRRKGKRNK